MRKFLSITSFFKIKKYFELKDNEIVLFLLFNNKNLKKELFEKIEQFKHLIEEYDEVVLISHTNPDGDALGSILAMFHILTEMNIKVLPVLPNGFPEFLSWLKGIEHIRFFKNEEKKVKQIILEAKLIICLDFNAMNRIEELAQTVLASNAIRVLIDHHPEPEPKFDIAISTTQISSTAELIYTVFKHLQLTNRINRDAAEALFVGIMTDTGSFSYACNYPSTFNCVADLLTKGINLERINQLVYSNNSFSRMKLLGYSLSEKLVVLPDYATAYITLSKSELEKYEYKNGDTEGIVNYALSIKGVVFAAIFIEKEKLIRISFRSKGVFQVNEFAKNHFEGGGHDNAAGGNAYTSLDKAVEIFVNLLPQYKEKIYEAL